MLSQMNLDSFKTNDNRFIDIFIKRRINYRYDDWMENTPIFGEIKDVYAQIWNKGKEEEF